MSEAIAAIFNATGKPYFSTTSSPTMIRHRAKSVAWKLIRKPSQVGKSGKKANKFIKKTISQERITAGFEFIGQPDFIAAKEFGIIS